MINFYQYNLLLEKRKKKKKKKKTRFNRYRGKYPLFWHGYPLGGYVQYGGPSGEGIGGEGGDAS